MAAILAALAGCSSSSSDDAPASGSLAQVMGNMHAHSLAVDPGDSDGLLLGLHGGLYRSDDGGRQWRQVGLSGDDSMNVVGGRGGAPLWVAGHEVLERSTDGGRTFEAVRPTGLPGLDLHGFAVREERPEEIYAAVSGEGLYRSTNGGRSFGLVTTEVGASVFGMAVAGDGTLFAADPSEGLLISDDGGRTYRRPLSGEGLVSVALEARQPGLVLAGGPGLFVSRNGGRTFEEGFTNAQLAAVAIAPGDPQRAYAIRVDGVVLVSSDGARTWSEAGA
ncbi:WD40/YVTN/BNR-like repeat-containing protein [Miltoncostaea marina]|uniref:WD40/YVTN/BNR-like repeat-containing protein n=1 Tax=Miltoncostaea marina TaxID=2843215 RepID=UPI001C3DF1B2|nr:sialidase family protein [Miltoncostaea marina]